MLTRYSSEWNREERSEQFSLRMRGEQHCPVCQKIATVNTAYRIRPHGPQKACSGSGHVTIEQRWKTFAHYVRQRAHERRLLDDWVFDYDRP